MQNSSDAAATFSTQVLVKTTSSRDGTALTQYPKGEPEVTILRISLRPKSRLALHKHPVINAGVLLKGKLIVVTDDGRTFNVAAGDPIVELVNQWHYGKNESDEPTEIIMFYAGTPGVPITVEQNIG